ncbi:hypothetical protein [Halorubrum laminariae]|uniref:Uncharacterized protein n=1 Tax=Halorubrum laminariae TaxID=1433523 RepID=A0ABD6C2A8_9EURY|nr:hypothetical protein [Halorubrum laminariae]
MTLITLIGGGVAAALATTVAVLVYRDATRVGVDIGSPSLWAALVILSSGASVATALLVPDAPIPGVLVLAVLGPLLYLLERDDSLHDDGPPDPTHLPSGSDATDDRDE